MCDSAEHRPHPSPPTPDRDVSRPATLSSEELLGGANQILITHEGDVYRLFRTKNNKLMLQK